MATQVGVVSQVIGEVFVQASDGSRRLLAEGDRVYLNEQIITADSGAVRIALSNGGEATLGRGDSLTLDNGLLSLAQGPSGQEAPASTPVDPAAAQSEVEALQAAIAAGADPTELAEATAAGPTAAGAPGAPGGAGSGHSFVLLDATADRVDPIVGYPTGPISAQIETLEDDPALFPDSENSIPSVSTPDLNADGDVVDESALPSGTGGGTLTTSGAFVINTGSEGLALLEVQDAAGNWISITAPGTLVTGLYGQLSVNPDGSWIYTLTSNSILHSDNSTSDGDGDRGAADQVFDPFQVRVTDSSGDVSPEATLTIAVNDDGPLLVDNQEGGLNGFVHEDALMQPGAPHEGNDDLGQQVSLSGPAGTLFSLVNFGADGPGSFRMLTDTSQLEAQGFKSAGKDLVYSVVGNTLTASVTGTEAGDYAVFTLTIGADGSYSFTLLGPLDHPVQDGNDAEWLSGLGIDFSSILQATDGDGDSLPDGFAAGTFTINVQDDVPVVSALQQAVASAVLDETGGLDTVNIAAADIVGLFNAPSYGADGAGSTSYSLVGSDGASTGLWLTGQSGAANEIQLVKVSDSQYEGWTGGNTTTGTKAFTVSINSATGAVTVTQHATLEHTVDGSTPADHDDSLSLTGAASLKVKQTVTDGDGDTASATSSNALAISFKDDGPTASAKDSGTASAVLDETGGLDTVNIAAADIVGLFNAPSYGADGAGSTSYSLVGSDGASTGLWLTGQSGAANEIQLVKVSDSQYEGWTGGNTTTGTKAFTVSINSATGAVTVTQHATLEHTVDGSTPADHDDSLSLTGAASLKVKQTVTDGDGDTASATSSNALAISFKDDGPTASAKDSGTASAVLDETGGLDTVNIAAADIVGLFNAPSYGADGAGSTSYSLVGSDGASTGLWLTGQSGAANEIQLVKVSDSQYEGWTGGNTTTGTKAFTVSINSATGAVTVTQHATLEHTVDGSTPADHDDSLSLTGAASLKVKQTVTDGDGDTASATSSNALAISFKDDGPSADEIKHTLQEPQGVNTNLMVVLDLSGSMDNSPGVAGFSTRLALAKDAIQQLINAYDGLGDVAVRLVTFNSSADSTPFGSADVWLSASAALTLIGSISDTAGSGTTNYDAALLTAQSAFASAGKIVGAQNVAYFLSDGQPNTSTTWPGVSGSGGSGINASEEAAWEAFLNTNDIKAYALGMGSGATQANLDPVAYNGFGAGSELDGIVVTDLSQLNAVLVGTVSSNVASGNLFDHVTFGADGAALNALVSVTHAGVTYNASDAVANLVTVNTAVGGKLVVNVLTGAYTYTSPLNVTADHDEVFTYQVKDSDGDLADANLTVCLKDSVPIAYDNKAYVEQSSNLTSGDFELGLAGWQTIGHVQDNGYNSSLVISGTRSALVRTDGDEVGATQVANFLGVTVAQLNAALNSYNGHSADSVQEGAAIKTQIHAQGGDVLSFKWNFVSNEKQSDPEDDAGFVIISNGTQQIIHVLSSADDNLGAGGGTGYQRQTGVQTHSVTLPSAWVAGLITVAFAALDDQSGSGGSDSKSALTIDDVSLNGQIIGPNMVSGNLLLDPNNDPLSADPYGATDQMLDGARLYKVAHGSHGEELMDADGVSFVTDLGGLFSLAADGAWTYQAPSGVSGIQSETFTYTLIDQDGDMDSATLTIAVAANGDLMPHTVVGSAANTALESLLGGANDDVLIGKGGNDQLTGGAGGDTFVWQAGHTGSTLITDFDGIGEGDALDFASFFQGETTSTLDSYLNFTFGADTVIHASSTGDLSGNEDQTVTLQGVDLSALYSSTDVNTVIQSMLDDGSLRIDTV